MVSPWQSFPSAPETPQANLVVGMKWLLGTFTGRFNRRHGLSGHLFGGRYKAQHLGERSEVARIEKVVTHSRRPESGVWGSEGRGGDSRAGA